MKAGYDFYIKFYKNKNFRNNQNYVLGKFLKENIIMEYIGIKNPVTSIITKEKINFFKKRKIKYHIKKLFYSKSKIRKMLESHYIFSDKDSLFFGEKF